MEGGLLTKTGTLNVLCVDIMELVICIVNGVELKWGQTMARYIDANEFKRKIEQYLPEDRDLALNVLKKVPTANVVPKEDIINELTNEISERIIQALEANYEIIPKNPVVRCKDCKHLIRSEGVCGLLSNNYEPPVYVDDDDFCSRGIDAGKEEANIYKMIAHLENLR